MFYMTFTNWIFLFSLPVVIVLDRVLSRMEPVGELTSTQGPPRLLSIHTLRQVLLLIASCLFYLTFGIENLYFLLLMTLILFVLTRYGDRQDKQYRKTLFAFIAFVPLSLLLGVDKIKFLMGYLPREMSLAQPMALSFVVFSSLSYVFDVRDRKLQAADYNLLDLALYLSFFPKLLQGPIAFARDFLPQMKTVRQQPGLNDFAIYVRRFIAGFAMKLLIADQLVTLSTPIASGATDGASIVLEMIFFYFRIFLDFASYSVMAIAVAGMLGFHIKENFNSPYRSLSIGEFWRRWHISLGSFFREYVYIPLGGSRAGNVYFNTMVVFALTGLWHGNGPLFLFWGLMHGAMICIERFLNKWGLLTRIPKVIRWVFIQVILVISWLPFYHDSLHDVKEYVLQIFNRPEIINFTYRYFLRPYPLTLLIISALISYKPGIELIEPGLNKFQAKYPKIDLVWRSVVSCALLILALNALASGVYQPFLYFRF